MLLAGAVATPVAAFLSLAAAVGATARAVAPPAAESAGIAGAIGTFAVLQDTGHWVARMPIPSTKAQTTWIHLEVLRMFAVLGLPRRRLGKGKEVLGGGVDLPYRSKDGTLDRRLAYRLI